MSSRLVPVANTDDVEQPVRVTECANCGAPIDRNEWHPVRAKTVDDEFRIYAFCSDDCRASWSGPDR
ncbi:DUF7576 family protein [Natronoarchaeum rubrum]|uniref:DUF7576 family protein n=1 Tax=Natronoarchaeum rubrum TaxID=755311 RepID=UPI00211327A3|nr:hypothetical protein [Natronoarchaeum rubrum]